MARPDLTMIEARALDAIGSIDAGDVELIQRGATRRIVVEDVPALVARVRKLEADRALWKNEAKKWQAQVERMVSS